MQKSVSFCVQGGSRALDPSPGLNELSSWFKRKPRPPGQSLPIRAFAACGIVAEEDLQGGHVVARRLVRELRRPKGSQKKSRIRNPKRRRPSALQWLRAVKRDDRREVSSQAVQLPRS